MKYRLDLTTYYLNDLGNETKCQDFINMLEKYKLVPEKFDEGTERMKFTYNYDDFLKQWLNKTSQSGLTIMLKAKRFYSVVNMGGRKPHCSYIIINGLNYVDINEVLRLANDFCVWSRSVFGYVYIKGMADLYTPGLDIFDCLPDITWINQFGKPYIDMWGEEKILNAPAWRKEKMPDGGYIIVTYEDPIKPREETQALEENLKTYLGVEYFARKLFIDENERLSVAQLIEKVANPKPITGYITPDFPKYYPELRKN